MFKLKVNRLKKSEVLSILELIEGSNYTYVLCDDSTLFEDGKVNILIDENNLVEIKKMIKLLRVGEDYLINAENECGMKRIDVKAIEYFEALDNDVFAIIGKERYTVIEKLYVLEESLVNMNFIRISKSFLVNLRKIEYIKPLVNSKLKLIMTNGDILEVNRTYVKDFKKQLKL